MARKRSSGHVRARSGLAPASDVLAPMSASHPGALGRRHPGLGHPPCPIATIPRVRRAWPRCARSRPWNGARPRPPSWASATACASRCSTERAPSIFGAVAQTAVEAAAPNAGFSADHVRFCADFVRFTPRNRPSWWCPRSSGFDPTRTLADCPCSRSSRQAERYTVTHWAHVVFESPNGYADAQNQRSSGECQLLTQGVTEVGT